MRSSSEVVFLEENVWWGMLLVMPQKPPDILQGRIYKYGEKSHGYIFFFSLKAEYLICTSKKTQQQNVFVSSLISKGEGKMCLRKKNKEHNMFATNQFQAEQQQQQKINSILQNETIGLSSFTSIIELSCAAI